MKKNKLELKHISSYVSHGLKVQFKNGETDVITDVDYVNGIIGFLNRNENYLLYDNNFKLILIPLSQLFTRINNEFESYNNKEMYSAEIIDLFCEENTGVTDYENCDLKKLPYECVKYIFANRYDYYELIPKGLAININTLKQTK